MLKVSDRTTFHYLPARSLDALKNVELTASQLVEGTLAGLHRSPYNGFSPEFSEHRKYCPGDPVRLVDWSVFARTDRYYVKQFQEETNTRCYCLLDISASMALGRDGSLRKFNYAAYLVAAFLYLMQRQRDAVGLFTYADDVRTYVPARGAHSHLRRLLTMLEGLEPTGASAATAAFHRIADEIPRRSMVLIFSDFLDRQPDFVKSLEHFRYNGCELLLFQVLDPLETDFPYRGLTEFRDLETDEVVELESEAYRDAYLDAFNAYNRDLRDACGHLNVGLETLTLATPFERALLAYFYKRQHLF